MAKRQDLITVVVTASTYIGSSTNTHSSEPSSPSLADTAPTTISSRLSVASDILSPFATSKLRSLISTSSTSSPGPSSKSSTQSSNGISRPSPETSALPLGSPASLDPLIHSKSPQPTPYNPTNLIVASVIIGLIVITILSWFIRRRIRRNTQRDLEILANDSTENIDGSGFAEKRAEGMGRRSAVGETFVRPMSVLGSEEHLLGGGMGQVEDRRSSLAVSVVSMRESVIGVATTTSMPASSSKSAVCEDYPDRKSAGESQAGKSRRKPAPSDPGLLSVSLVPMSQMDNRKTCRSPTESIYACYEDPIEVGKV